MWRSLAVLACLGRRKTWVQIPPSRLGCKQNMANTSADDSIRKGDSPIARKPQFQKDSAPRRERVNDQIRISPIQVIDQDGKNLGVIPTPQAQELAKQADLDLVEINPTARPPSCKIIDYGHYRFKQSKRNNANKPHKVKLKEIRMGPKIEEHDLNVKIKRAREFLLEGCKVQISMQFKGREIIHKALGEQQLETALRALEDIAKADKKPEMQGRRMLLSLSPITSKKPK